MEVAGVIVRTVARKEPMASPLLLFSLSEFVAVAPLVELPRVQLIGMLGVAIVFAVTGGVAML